MDQDHKGFWFCLSMNFFSPHKLVLKSKPVFGFQGIYEGLKLEWGNSLYAINPFNTVLVTSDNGIWLLLIFIVTWRAGDPPHDKIVTVEPRSLVKWKYITTNRDSIFNITWCLVNILMWLLFWCFKLFHCNVLFNFYKWPLSFKSLECFILIICKSCISYNFSIVLIAISFITETLHILYVFCCPENCELYIFFNFFFIILILKY